MISRLMQDPHGEELKPMASSHMVKLEADPADESNLQMTLAWESFTATA